MRLFCFISMFFIFGCATLSDQKYELDVQILQVAMYTEKNENYISYIGAFELKNETQHDLCLKEDIFVNKTSPYVELVNLSQKIKGVNEVPNAPKSAETFRLKAQSSRKFFKVLEYNNKAELMGKYKISIVFTLCDHSDRFYKKSIYIG